MNNNVSKILSIVAGVIGVVAIFFLARIIMEGDETVKSSLELQNSIVSPFIQFAKIILIITALLAIGFSLFNLVRQPKMLKKALISIAALGIVLVISYVMASDAAVYDVSGNVLKDGEAGSTSKWVSTGIIYSLFLGAIGLGFFLWDFVKSLVSK
jgi:hypothetical protein